MDSFRYPTLMSTACALGFLFCPGSSATAEPGDCVPIEMDLDRLACYDKEAGRTSTPSPAQSRGKWQMSSTPSALTGLNDVIVSLNSRHPVQCRWNSGSAVKLTLSCVDNLTKLVLDTGCYMASSQFEDYGHVTYRADEEQAKVVAMDASPDNKALGLWSGDKSIPVIRDLLGKSQLIVKMTPFAESPITTSFDISGMDEAIQGLRKECGW